MAQILYKLLEVGDGPERHCDLPDVATNAENSIRKSIFFIHQFYVLKVYKIKVLQIGNLHNTIIRGQKGKITCPA